jgi:hypothetical protein
MQQNAVIFAAKVSYFSINTFEKSGKRMIPNLINTNNVSIGGYLKLLRIWENRISW